MPGWTGGSGPKTSNDLVNIPGFLATWQLERVQDWPLVWFPVLGEGRVNQLKAGLDSGGG